MMGNDKLVEMRYVRRAAKAFYSIGDGPTYQYVDRVLQYRYSTGVNSWGYHEMSAWQDIPEVSEEDAAKG